MQVGRLVRGVVMAVWLVRTGEALRPCWLLDNHKSAPAPGRRTRRLEATVHTPESPAVAESPSSKLYFPKLDDSFRHPLDADLTAAIRMTPVSLLESAAREVGSATIEQSIRLDNLAFSVRVSEAQLPGIHELFVEASKILNMDALPELYVRSDPRPNAYTLAVQGSTPCVVLTSSLVELLDDRELQAVMGHELAHLKCEHSLWLLLGRIAAVVALPVVDSFIERVVRQWSRAAEFSCDRGALLVVQDPKTVVSALLKLVSGLGPGLDADAFVAQAEEYRKALDAATPFVRSNFSRQQMALSHPLTIDRVLELKKWANTPHFRAILASGVALPSTTTTTSSDEQQKDNTSSSSS